MGATTILTTDTPQTIINDNNNVGEVFTFEAGTHNITATLVPSANDQVFQGETNGTPVELDPLDPLGSSLGKSKTLWASGTPTSIIDGGSTALGFMLDTSSPTSWTGIVIKQLKLQNFNPGSSGANALVGGRYTDGWVIEDNWLVGGELGVKLGDSMIVRHNRIEGQTYWWLQGFQVTGTVADPTIIADNDVFDINLAEDATPNFDAGFKISSTVAGFIEVLRNWIHNVHGPAIWFDNAGGGSIQIRDNITVDCGINDGGGEIPQIFYEICDGHIGAKITNNWCLGFAAHIRISQSHGSSSDYIEVLENTVDCDASDRQGIHITDDKSAGNVVGGDSTTAPAHPVINTNSLPVNRHYSDYIRIKDNVIRKRNSSFADPVPMGGAQVASANADLARNYEWIDNKYEVHTDISSPFKWTGGNMNFSTWKGKRAATGDTENTGPFFDVDGSFVTWSGTKQFSDTTNNWEGHTTFQETIAVASTMTAALTKVSIWARTLAVASTMTVVMARVKTDASAILQSWKRNIAQVGRYFQSGK